MKKLLISLLILTLLLSGCGRTMDDVIRDEPSITGIVTQVWESSIVIDAQGSEYVVSTDTELADSYSAFSVGDEVVVYFDGNVAETYPMQIHTVYAITLRNPAHRGSNEAP